MNSYGYRYELLFRGAHTIQELSSTVEREIPTFQLMPATHLLIVIRLLIVDHLKKKQLDLLIPICVPYTT
jgi:hypothetical protein